MGFLLDSEFSMHGPFCRNARAVWLPLNVLLLILFVQLVSRMLHMHFPFHLTSFYVNFKSCLSQAHCCSNIETERDKMTLDGNGWV
jgi:hypothetical protein